MATLLAQMMPGMEWIPVMLLSTVSGLVAGLIAIVLRPFARARIAGRRLALAALVIGIASPVFFLCVVGSELLPMAYLILASPAALGGVAIQLYLRRQAVSESRDSTGRPRQRGHLSIARRSQAQFRVAVNTAAFLKAVAGMVCCVRGIAWGSN